MLATSINALQETVKSHINEKKCSLKSWADFQKLIKNHYLLLLAESKFTSSSVNELKELIAKYYELRVKFKQESQKLNIWTQSLPKPEEAEMKKVFINKDTSEVRNYVLRMLQGIRRDPRILAEIFKSDQTLSSLSGIEESLANCFFENLLLGTDSDSELLRFLIELIRVEIDRAKAPTDMFTSDSFLTRLTRAYLKRDDYRGFLKVALRDTLQPLTRDAIVLSVKESTYEVWRGLTSRIIEFMEKKRSMMLKKDKPDPFHFLKKTRTHTVSHNNTTMSDISMSMDDDIKRRETKRGNDILKGDGVIDVNKIRITNMMAIKTYIQNILNGLRKSLAKMPVGIRILFKYTYNQLREKFAEASEDEVRIVIQKFFITWLADRLRTPYNAGILENYDPSVTFTNNVGILTMILEKLFNNQTKIEEYEDLEKEFIEISKLIREYFSELIDVSNLNFEQTDKTQEKKFYSMCLSISEIKKLAQTVEAHKTQILNKSNDYRKFLDATGTVTANLEMLDKEIIDRKAKAEDIFILYQDLETEIGSYVEKFTKPPKLTDIVKQKARNLAVIVHQLLNFLLIIDDINDKDSHSDIKLQDLVSLYEDKTFNVTRPMINEESLDFTARQLTYLMGKIDKNYTQNNFFGLYDELYRHYVIDMEDIEKNISSTKLNLLKSIDSLKRKICVVKKLVEERSYLVKRLQARYVIDNISIPVCLTTPSNKRKLPNLNKSSKKRNNDIVIAVRTTKRCDHEKILFITQLADHKGAMPLGGASSTRANLKLQKYHQDKVREFAEMFGSLDEVKEFIDTGNDEYGVRRAFKEYSELFEKELGNFAASNKKIMEDYQLYMDEFENIMSKTIYDMVFPSEPTVNDVFYYNMFRVNDWIPQLSPGYNAGQWDRCALILNQIDEYPTALAKFQVITDFTKQAQNIIRLEGGEINADSTLTIILPILIYTAPKKFHSNLIFMDTFKRKRNDENECWLTGIQAAITKLKELQGSTFELPQEEYINKILKRQQEIRETK